MKFEQLTIKGFLSSFVVIFCLVSLAFKELQDSVISLYSVLVTAIISYYFGSSSGSKEKDKLINDLNTQIKE